MAGTQPNRPIERVLLWALLAAAAAAALLLVALVAQRIGHPYELEWMEGAMVDHAGRVFRGLDVYTAPGVEHVAYLYTPMLYYLGALLMHVTGEGYLALRIVSLAGTVTCIAAVYALVAHETGQRRYGVVAAGLFCAGYGLVRTWYDVGRCDMLFQAGLLVATCLLRMGTTSATAVLAALAWTFAYLSKQVATFWIPMLAGAALLFDRRRGLIFCVCAGTAFVVTLVAYHFATDGWFSFFVFTMPRRTGSTPEHWLGYWTIDLVPTWPLLAASILGIVCLWRTEARRRALAFAAFGFGGLVTSYASRVHAGGFENVLLYGFTAMCYLGPSAIAFASTRRQRIAVQVLLLAQFVFLVIDVRALVAAFPPLLYDPRMCLPRQEQIVGTDALVEWIRAQDGPVWPVFHGHLATLAGKQPHAHALAMADMLHYSRQSPADDRAVVAMNSSIQRALAEHGLAAVVLELPLGRRFEELFAEQLVDYERRELDLRAGPMALWSVVGMPAISPYALVLRR